MIEAERKYGIVFFLRWKKAVQWMESLAREKVGAFLEEVGPVILLGPLLSRRFTRVTLPSLLLLLAVAIPMVGGLPATVITLVLGLLGAAFYILGSYAVTIILTYLNGGTPLPGIAPVIPGVSIGPYHIPFLEGWLSILLIFLIHEGAHGIVSLRRKIPIHDVAAVILGIIPVAAYVMPDEERFKRSDPSTKVKILSAGPTANAFVFALVTPLMILLGVAAQPLIESVYAHYALGVKVLEVPEVLTIDGKPVHSLVKGIIEPGDIIVSVNGKPVRTVTDIIEAIRSATGETISIEFIHNGKVETITLPNKGYIGIRGGETVWRENPPLWYHLLTFLLRFLALFAMLNVAVAVFNALPFSFLDGGQVAEEVEKVWGIKASPLKALATLLILLNALPWFLQ